MRYGNIKMHLYPITDLSSIDDLTEVEVDVINLKRDHSLYWNDKKEVYRYLKLVEEIGKIGEYLSDSNKDPDWSDSPDWELREIISICTNWLEMRFTGPIETIDFKQEEKHE